MDEKVTRETIRRVSVPYSTVPVVLPGRYGRGNFRISSVTERLVEPAPPYGSAYQIKIEGPFQTSKGNDHASRTGYEVYEPGGMYAARALTEFPSVLLPLLWGARGLSEHRIAADVAV